MLRGKCRRVLALSVVSHGRRRDGARPRSMRDPRDAAPDDAQPSARAGRRGGREALRVVSDEEATVRSEARGAENVRVLAASLSNPCRLKNKWHPGLRKRPFSIFLSDEENDTDEEFALRRAEACKEYRKVVESTLDHLKSSLCSRDGCRTPDTTLSVNFSHQGTPGTAEQRTPRFGRTQISYSRLLIHHRHGIGYAH